MALVSDKYITILDDHYGALDVAGWITTLKADFDEYVAGTKSGEHPSYVAYEASWLENDADGKVVRPNITASTKIASHPHPVSYDSDACDFGHALVSRFGLPVDDSRFIGYLTTLANTDTGWCGVTSGKSDAPGYTTGGVCRVELVITPSASNQVKFRDQVAADGTNATALDTTMAETTYSASLRILGDVYENKKTAGANEIVCWFLAYKDYAYDEVRNAALTAIGEIGNVDGDGYITA